jgi:nicotinate phosphoribosyltransferase
VDHLAPALLVDLYELAMVDVYRREGMAERPATFSLFARELPDERNVLVAAGLDDVLAWLEQLSFGASELGALEQLGRFDADFLDWLSGVRFTGAVRAVAEGTPVFPNEPILEIDAPLAEAQLAETLALNQVTLQTTLATKGARMVEAAGGRAIVDFALRRTQGIDAGMKLVRVGALVGFAGTSNVAGAHAYDVPASGTMAHSFVQAYRDETDAFRAFAQVHGAATVLLVDTYDSIEGIEHAITVAGEMREQATELLAVRLDSGDLASLAFHARRRLDETGFPDVQIFASGGLDEYLIDALLRVEGAPIDGFGVGSSLGVSADAPVFDSVYKLVEYDGRPVRKTSTGKATWPGAKQVWRAGDWSHDVVSLAGEPAPEGDHRPLLEPVMLDGERTAAGRRSLPDANGYFRGEWAQLPTELRSLHDATEHDVRISAELRQLTDRLDAERHDEEDEDEAKEAP